MITNILTTVGVLTGFLTGLMTNSLFAASPDLIQVSVEEIVAPLQIPVTSENRLVLSQDHATIASEKKLSLQASKVNCDRSKYWATDVPVPLTSFEYGGPINGNSCKPFIMASCGEPSLDTSFRIKAFIQAKTPLTLTINPVENQESCLNIDNHLRIDNHSRNARPRKALLLRYPLFHLESEGGSNVALTVAKQRVEQACERWRQNQIWENQSGRFTFFSICPDPKLDAGPIIDTYKANTEFIAVVSAFEGYQVQRETLRLNDDLETGGRAGIQKKMMNWERSKLGKAPDQTNNFQTTAFAFCTQEHRIINESEGELEWISECVSIVNSPI